ncbi:MAG TPA: tetratricopeptide repeat protein [Planctomycetota bacterium]|nr:tetratricopeptide repeat protein [Planctomycetota bacterium]
MNRTLRSAALAALLLPALFTGAARADVIHLVDGSTLTDVEIKTETLAGVTYEQKGKSGVQTLDPDKVHSIEYRRLPSLLDQADALARDGALSDAIERFNVFVEGISSGENKKDRQAWAPAYALQRVIELRTSLGDAEGVIKAADALLAKVPDSRHAPDAQLAKAEALKAQGKDPQAKQALDDLRTMIDAKALSKRWTLELQLAEVLFDASLKGQAKRDRLIEIAGQAGRTYPAVANRARVSEGETYLEGTKPDFAAAKKVFEKILADPKADDATMAGAYTGMGDCLFHEAAAKGQGSDQAQKDLDAALMAYMRVAVNYRDQTRYAPKAMFYAGRSLDLRGEVDGAAKANARRLYSAVITNYPGSEWAREARNVRR